MLTFSECILKADELTSEANGCHADDVRDQYLNLAQQWRLSAIEAARQDAFAATEPTREVS